MTKKNFRQTINLLVIGPRGSGRTAFIRTISQIEALTDSSGMDFGYVDVDDNELRITLFGVRQEPQHGWGSIVESILGFVLIVDSTDPESIAQAKVIRDAVLERNSLPYVVAANKQDLAGALSVETLRHALDIAPAIAVLPCVATDRESVKEVLLSLIYAILDDMESETTTPAVPL